MRDAYIVGVGDAYGVGVGVRGGDTRSGADVSGTGGDWRGCRCGDDGFGVALWLVAVQALLIGCL